MLFQAINLLQHIPFCHDSLSKQIFAYVVYYPMNVIHLQPPPPQLWAPITIPAQHEEILLLSWESLLSGLFSPCTL